MGMRKSRLALVLYFLVPFAVAHVCFDHPNPLRPRQRVPVACLVEEPLLSESELANYDGYALIETAQSTSPATATVKGDSFSATMTSVASSSASYAPQSMLKIDFSCQLDPELCEKAQRAFTKAGQIIEDVIQFDVPVLVNASFFSFSTDPLYANMAKDGLITLGGSYPARTIPQADTDGVHRFYPQALVKQVSQNSKYQPQYGPYDIASMFNSDAPFWFEEDAEPIMSNQSDFLYVVVHEFIHGLGFYTNWEDYFNDVPVALTPDPISISEAAYNMISSSTTSSDLSKDTVNGTASSASPPPSFSSTTSSALAPSSAPSPPPMQYVFEGFFESALDKYIYVRNTTKRLSLFTKELNKIGGGMGKLYDSQNALQQAIVSSDVYQRIASQIFDLSQTPSALEFIAFEDTVRDTAPSSTYPHAASGMPQQASFLPNMYDILPLQVTKTPFQKRTVKEPSASKVASPTPIPTKISSRQKILLETSINYTAGSSISHVDYKTYTYTSDYLMRYLQDQGVTLASKTSKYKNSPIGPELRAMLRTLGYKVHNIGGSAVMAQSSSLRISASVSQSNAPSQTNGQQQASRAVNEFTFNFTFLTTAIVGVLIYVGLMPCMGLL